MIDSTTIITSLAGFVILFGGDLCEKRREVEAEKRKNPKEKKDRKRQPVGPKGEQKITVTEKTDMHFYNPDFHREIF